MGDELGDIVKKFGWESKAESEEREGRGWREQGDEPGSIKGLTEQVTCLDNPYPGKLIQLCAVWNSETNTATTAHISMLRHTPSKHSTLDHPRITLFDHPNTRG